MVSTCVSWSFVSGTTCRSSPSTSTRCPCRRLAVGGVSWLLLPPSRRLSPRPRPAGSCDCWWTWRRGPEGGAASPLYSWGNLSWRPLKKKKQKKGEWGEEDEDKWQKWWVRNRQRREWREQRGKWRQRDGRKIICHLRQGIKASQRESYQATRREAALLKCWHSAVCESVRMCALSGAGRKLGPFFRIEGVFMSNSSDLAPSAFSANKGQLRQLLFWACESPVCRHAGAEHRISSENALV